MEKKTPLDTKIYPLDDDWADFTVNLNDGWADDVSLVYPEGRWRPEGELTSVSTNTEEEPASGEQEQTTSSSSSNLASPKKVTKSKGKKKRNTFRTFMIVWLGSLAIIIAIALGYFYQFLERYEAAYQISRPYHDMDDIMSVFESRDIDTIYNMLTLHPVICDFENEDTIKGYMLSLLADKELTYVKGNHYTEDYPEYYIEADGYIVAELSLLKSPVESHDYGFPVWYISSFEFYTIATEECRIEAPENCTVYINGIAVSDNYCCQDHIELEENVFVQPYASLPQVRDYYTSGLYTAPTVTAIDCFGNPSPVSYNAETKTYEVAFSSASDDAESMKQYAIDAVTAYANYVSNDSPDDALDGYFASDCEILAMIKANTSRQYYTAHHTPEIKNVEVVDFIVYSEDVYYCEVYLEQHMLLSWGGDPEIVPTDAHFYFVNINGEWKVTGIQY